MKKTSDTSTKPPSRGHSYVYKTENKELAGNVIVLSASLPVSVLMLSFVMFYHDCYYDFIKTVIAK